MTKEQLENTICGRLRKLYDDTTKIIDKYRNYLDSKLLEVKTLLSKVKNPELVCIKLSEILNLDNIIQFKNFTDNFKEISESAILSSSYIQLYYQYYEPKDRKHLNCNQKKINRILSEEVLEKTTGLFRILNNYIKKNGNTELLKCKVEFDRLKKEALPNIHFLNVSVKNLNINIKKMVYPLLNKNPNINNKTRSKYKKNGTRSNRGRQTSSTTVKGITTEPQISQTTSPDPQISQTTSLELYTLPEPQISHTKTTPNKIIKPLGSMNNFISKLSPINEESEEDLKSKTPSPTENSIKISNLLNHSRKTRSKSLENIFNFGKNRTQ